MILLDLFSEAEPQYTRFESFYGHYYIWNMLHDFGGNNYMFGSLMNVTNVGRVKKTKPIDRLFSGAPSSSYVF